MVSSWEELETKSKDDLIIELMYWRTLYSILYAENPDENWPDEDRRGYIDEYGSFTPGEWTTHEWAKKIAKYGIARVKTEDFCSCDLMDYGVCGDQCEEICSELIESGEFDLPEGVVYYGREDD